MKYDSIDKKIFKESNRISRKYNKQWNAIAGRGYIGDCSNLFQRLKPTSYYDFYLKYTQDGEETKHDRKTFKYCGRTEEEVEELANLYKSLCKDDSFTIEEYIRNIYMHTLIETYDGQMKEVYVTRLLTNMGYTYEKPNSDEDGIMGIDFKVFKNNELKFVIQVKPYSFFKGNSNKALIEDRINAFNKEQKVTNILKVPTYYMVYESFDDGTIKWLNENGKFAFELSRLCNKDGISYNSKYNLTELTL